MFKEPIYLPTCTLGSSYGPDPLIEQELTAYFHQKAHDIRTGFENNSPLPCFSPPDCKQIISILLHRKFNYLSRSRNTHHLPALQAWAAHHLRRALPLNLFLLYHGGYRAWPSTQNRGLTFHPDQTEFLLLGQIATLHHTIQQIYPPGIRFTIVINNGVASWTNDIPLHLTRQYAARLRRMIASINASGRIHVMLQSELPGFEPGPSWEQVAPLQSVSQQEHLLLERFLNRECSEEEAKFRAALYRAAEAKWAGDLKPWVQSAHALVLRQVEHPATLPFRPFPGGAIRVQNGSLGFRRNHNALIPVLVTSKTLTTDSVRCVHCAFPFVPDESPPAESLHAP